MKEGKNIPLLCDLLLEEYDVDMESALCDVRAMNESMCTLGTVKTE